MNTDVNDCIRTRMHGNENGPTFIPMTVGVFL